MPGPLWGPAKRPGHAAPGDLGAENMTTDGKERLRGAARVPWALQNLTVGKGPGGCA